MSALRTLIHDVAISRGATRQRILYILRRYIKGQSDDDMKAAIKRITDIRNLKILWEAGLNAELQQAVAVREEELQKRRER